MNKAIIMGRLTRDPEMRVTNTNKSVCRFTVAVNRKFTRQGEESQADFIPIVAWEKTAEFCNNYFKKGQQVAVVGRIQISSWDDSEGKKRYTTEIVAEEVHFAESKKGDFSSGNQSLSENSQDKDDGFYPIDDTDELPF